MTHWAGKAWDKLCRMWKFSEQSKKLGMALTVSGEHDDKINLQGLGHVKFSREDIPDGEDNPLLFGVNGSQGIPWRAADKVLF